MGITKLARELVDFLNELPPVLVFVPGGFSTDSLESRTQPPITEDTGAFEFVFGNVSVLNFTDIEIFLLFDFTGTHVGVSLDASGPFVEKSLFLQSPLTLTFNSLGPGQRTDSQKVFIKSNLNNMPATHGNYQIGLTGKFKAEPVLQIPEGGKPPAITGGIIPFSVVDD